MERRFFLKQTGIVAGATLLAPSLLSAQRRNDIRLVILHTNDTHSNMDPFPANHSRYPGMGGVTRRAALIEKIRSEEDHVLLLDSGDIFQGTPYFNKYKGVLEMKVLTEMKYDAATMGNHDFDIGMEGFLHAKQFANFPFVSANYDFSATVLKDEVVPHIVLRRDRLKIGIFGLGINLTGLVADNNHAGMIYRDPVEIARDQVAALRQQQCDLIICLSHLGYEYPNEPEMISDRKLAEQTEGIDIILGGHTHTFLETPVIMKNAAGENVLINQVGYAGLYLGRIDLICSRDNRFEVAGTPLRVN